MDTQDRTAGALRQLLVATDGTATGTRAVAFALALAKRFGSTLLLCCAVDEGLAAAECSAAGGGLDFMQIIDAQTDAAKAVLAAAAKSAADAGISTTTTLLDGRPADAIVTCAHERAVDAIVMGTQGKNALERFFVGSTAEGVLRGAQVPVFVVPPGAAHADAHFDELLVAVDDSDPSQGATALAIELAQTTGAKAVFCGVMETVNLRGMATTYGYDPMPIAQELRSGVEAVIAAHAASARDAGIRFDSLLVEGEAAAEIVKAADTCAAGLIVIGTHGRRGLHRLVVGSVAEGVVRNSHVPVAVVRVVAATAPAAPSVRGEVGAAARAS